jgi:hypothetical protein
MQITINLPDSLHLTETDLRTELSLPSTQQSCPRFFNKSAPSAVPANLPSCPKSYGNDTLTSHNCSYFASIPV